MISTQRDLFYWENSRQRRCTFESKDPDGTPRLSRSSADEEGLPAEMALKFWCYLISSGDDSEWRTR
jgi:hypothetical protein